MIYRIHNSFLFLLVLTFFCNWHLSAQVQSDKIVFGEAHVVSLTSGNSIYVDVKPDLNQPLPEKIFASDGTGRFYEGSYDGKAYFVIDGLPDNKSLKVFYVDAQGQAKSIGKVETSYYEGELLPISMSLHRYLKRSIRENKMSLRGCRQIKYSSSSKEANELDVSSILT